ncbi:putative lipid II flippase FtsW [Gordonia humi]|uniref:Probable peptidoglycan glycosyltransferase FtsW n=1 Tax=Gordonia humi TaxID=686429 RepID=A0A840F331_9ACTN|nr:putative lipid II flippase FtsW [Gordonia humi]MBB4136893.1 cell division protein FtsW [Gordonia humi]
MSARGNRSPRTRRRARRSVADDLDDFLAVDDEAVDDETVDDETGNDQDRDDQAGGDEKADGTDGVDAEAADADDSDDEPDPARTRRSRARRTEAPARSLDLSMSSVDVRGGLATVRDGIKTLLAKPLTSFHMVLSLTVILTAFGLIMVLSASSVEGYSLDGSAYGMFTTQATFAVLGLIMFYATLKTPIRYFRKFATVGIMVSILLLVLVLVPGIGVTVNGARRWFSVAGLSVQPSELVKVALCVWGAHLLASRRSVGAFGKELLLPLVPVGILVCALIILEPNQSTTMIIGLIVAALLWFAGLPGRVFGGFAVVFVAVGVALALSSTYRAARVFSFLGQSNDPLGDGYQATQAQYALANGGLFGVGLGQSTAKWNYLPNAHNDFIFAIIGEELGLVGAFIVVALFVLLGWVGMRIARRSIDPFLRLLSATITVLFLVQAFINIGYVVGLLPVTGIQLPILSNGGTSMLTMLTMLGLLATAARHEPDAVRALNSTRPTGLSRILRLPVPAMYRPPRTEQLRDRLERRRTGQPDRRRPAPVRSPRPRRTAAPAARGAGAVRSGEIHYPGGRGGSVAPDAQYRPGATGRDRSPRSTTGRARSARPGPQWPNEREYRRR